MGNSDHGTTYMRVGGDDGELNGNPNLPLAVQCTITVKILITEDMRVKVQANTSVAQRRNLCLSLNL